MTFAAEGDAAESVMAAFTAAEIAIKKNERFTLALPVAAVNQLRYAAKHLACAMQSGTGVKDRSEQLNKAVCHCDRARFDALDGIIYSALDFIAAFQRLCRTRRNVAAVYPNLRQDYDEIAGLQERLQALPKVQDMTSDALAEMEALAEKFISFKRRILRFIPIVEKRERIFADENAWFFKEFSGNSCCGFNHRTHRNPRSRDAEGSAKEAFGRLADIRPPSMY